LLPERDGCNLALSGRAFFDRRAGKNYFGLTK
jgi:hypothetical protein